jgi:hypothetical protein
MRARANNVALSLKTYIRRLSSALILADDVYLLGYSDRGDHK